MWLILRFYYPFLPETAPDLETFENEWQGQCGVLGDIYADYQASYECDYAEPHHGVAHRDAIRRAFLSCCDRKEALLFLLSKEVEQ